MVTARGEAIEASRASNADLFRAVVGGYGGGHGIAAALGAGQFARAYPEHRTFARIKAEYDPQRRFRNLLWDKYLPR